MVQKQQGWKKSKHVAHSNRRLGKEKQVLLLRCDSNSTWTFCGMLNLTFLKAVQLDTGTQMIVNSNLKWNLPCYRKKGCNIHWSNWFKLSNANILQRGFATVWTALGAVSCILSLHVVLFNWSPSAQSHPKWPSSYINTSLAYIFPLNATKPVSSEENLPQRFPVCLNKRSYVRLI